MTAGNYGDTTLNKYFSKNWLICFVLKWDCLHKQKGKFWVGQNLPFCFKMSTSNNQSSEILRSQARKQLGEAGERAKNKIAFRPKITKHLSLPQRACAETDCLWWIVNSQF